MVGMKHTPGPWRASSGLFGSVIVGPASLKHPGHAAIEYARLHGLPDPLERRAADVSMIEAAPEMHRILLLLMDVAPAFQAGARGGEVMGLLSNVMDEARVVLGHIEGVQG